MTTVKRRAKCDPSSSLTLEALLLSLGDTLLLLGSAQVSALLLFDGRGLVEMGYLSGAWIGTLTVLLALFAGDCYSQWQVGVAAYQHRLVSRGLLLGFAVFALELKLGVVGISSWSWLLLWSGLAAVGLLASRSVLFAVLRKLRRHGIGLRKLLLITAGADCVLSTQLRPEVGYAVQATLDIDDLMRDWKVLAQHVQRQDIDEVWVSVPKRQTHLLDEVVNALWETPVEVLFVPEFRDSRRLNSAVRWLDVDVGYGLMLTYTPLGSRSNRALKRVTDLVLASVIGLLILPLCAAIALAVRCTSPGPALFRQSRHGEGGSPIEVYKFRTMYVDQPEPDKVHQACRDDPRVTPIGRFLRRTSLDELPQFFNVLQGRMSIVGPRPHALTHNEYYKSRVESYMWRHRVKPGITGWAQVNGHRGETDTLEKMEKRVEHDLWYIDNWSLWLDFKVIALTIKTVFVDYNAY